MTCPYCADSKHVMSTEAGPGPLCGDQAATGSLATPGRRQDAELSDNAQVKAVGGGATSEKLTPPPSLLSVEASPSGATAGLENPASRSSMELRGRLTETPTENGRLGGRCPHASTEGSESIEVRR